MRRKLWSYFVCFTSQVNSYGHCGTVSSPNHTFSWAGLNKRLRLLVFGQIWTWSLKTFITHSLIIESSKNGLVCNELSISSNHCKMHNWGGMWFTTKWHFDTREPLLVAHTTLLEISFVARTVYINAVQSWFTVYSKCIQQYRDTNFRLCLFSYIKLFCISRLWCENAKNLPSLHLIVMGASSLCKLLVFYRLYTLISVFSDHSQKDQKWFYKANYRLMQVKSIAECSKGSILQYFRPAFGYLVTLRPFCIFLCGRLIQYCTCLFALHYSQTRHQMIMWRPVNEWKCHAFK